MEGLHSTAADGNMNDAVETIREKDDDDESIECLDLPKGEEKDDEEEVDEPHNDQSVSKNDIETPKRRGRPKKPAAEKQRKIALCLGPDEVKVLEYIRRLSGTDTWSDVVRYLVEFWQEGFSPRTAATMSLNKRLSTTCHATSKAGGSAQVTKSTRYQELAAIVKELDPGTTSGPESQTGMTTPRKRLLPMDDDDDEAPAAKTASSAPSLGGKCGRNGKGDSGNGLLLIFSSLT